MRHTTKFLILFLLSALSLSAQTRVNLQTQSQGPASTQVQPTCAASTTFTMAATFQTDFFVNLNCNISTSTIAGTLVPGMEAVFSITQTGAGNNTFAWPTGFLNLPTLATGAGNTTVATFQYCGTTGNGSSCPANSWQNTDVGPTGVVIAGSKINAIDPTDPTYGVKFDGKLDVNCSWTAATPTVVTCPDVVYTSSDTGKACFGISAGLPAITVGTFTFTDSTHGTCSTGSASAPSAVTFMVCTDDTTAWGLVKTAFQALPKGGTIILPAGYSCTSTGLFNWLTATQGAGGPAVGEWGGITVVGKGSPVSQIIPMPNFNFASCTPASVCFGSTSNSGGTNFAHWAINGLNQSNVGGCGGGGLSAVSGANISRFSDFVITGWVTGCSSAFTCLAVTGQGDIVDGWSFVDTCGSTACFIASNGISLFNLYCRSGSNASAVALSVAASGGNCASSYGSTYGPATPFDLVTMASGSCLNSYGDTFESSNGGQTFTFDMSGGTLNLFGSQVQVGTTSNSSAFFFRSGTNVVHSQDSVIQGGSAQGMFGGSVTGNFFDQGGNTLASILGTNVNFLGEAGSANKTVVTAGKLVLSAGWGTTAAVTALSGGDAPIQFTVTNSGTGQGASPTITYTFPTPYLVAPYSCTATQTGGTNAIGTFTSSALSVTGVTFTFSLTPTAASTEIVQVTCVTP